MAHLSPSFSPLQALSSRAVFQLLMAAPRGRRTVTLVDPSDGPSHLAATPALSRTGSSVASASQSTVPSSSPPAPSLLITNSHARREVVLQKLREFYRTYCPAKEYMVPDIYDVYQHHPKVLFQRLLSTYPKAPNDYFDEITFLLTPPLQVAAVPAAALPGSNPSSTVGVQPTGDAASKPLPSALRGGGALIDATAVTRDSRSNSTSSLATSASGSTAGSTSVVGGVKRSNEAAIASVPALLAEGERLLAQSPPRLHPQANARGANAARSQTEEKHAQEEAELDHLLNSNLSLAAEVAELETFVLHRRWPPLLQRCLQDPRLDQDLARGTVTIEDLVVRRTFFIPASGAIWEYITNGPMRAPLHEETAHYCRLQCTFCTKVGLVDAALLASALRALAKVVPHTVTEERWMVATPPPPAAAAHPATYGSHPAPPAQATRYVFHSSGHIWWSWPSPTVVRPEPIPAPLPPAASAGVLRAASDGPFWSQSLSGRVDEAARSQPAPGHQVGAGGGDMAARLLLSDSAESSGKPAAYWTYFMDQWGVLEEQLRPLRPRSAE